jgi:hypothetical protein
MPSPAVAIQKAEVVPFAIPITPKVVNLTGTVQLHLRLAQAQALDPLPGHRHALQAQCRASGLDMQDLHPQILRLPTGGSSVSRACM